MDNEKITSAEVRTFPLQLDKTGITIVFVRADCLASAVLAPLVTKLKKEFAGELKIFDVNADYLEVPAEFGGAQVPAMLFFTKMQFAGTRTVISYRLLREYLDNFICTVTKTAPIKSDLERVFARQVEFAQTKLEQEIIAMSQNPISTEPDAEKSDGSGDHFPHQSAFHPAVAEYLGAVDDAVRNFFRGGSTAG